MTIEYLDIVDENDNVIDVVERSIAKQQKLKTRYIHIFIFNDAGEILIQQRSHTRGLGPNLIDPSTGGCVQSGESYEEAAIREMREEVSIKTDITHILDIAGWYGHCRLFTANYNGDFQVDNDESKHACFVSIEHLEFVMEHFPFTVMNGFLHSYKHYKEHINK